MADWTLKNIYFLSLMSLGYIVGEIAHFLINTSTRAVAQDIHYGDQACFRNLTVNVSENSNVTSCKDLDQQEDCVQHDHCSWDYNGLGLQYQILAGPSFIAVFTICCVIIGITSDNFVKVGRNRIMAVGVLVFSLSCFLMGFSNSYWQLVLLRMGIAAGESVCRPVSGSLITDIFSKGARGLANGILSWGVYYGYGLAFVIGIYVTQADILSYGWRASYVLSALPGFVLSILLFLTVSDPKKDEDNDSLEALNTASSPETLATPDEEEKSFLAYLKILARSLCSPTIVLLLIGACFRHTAGYCWAYNTRPYFQTYYPNFNLGLWIFACSVGGGSFGVFFGGYFSDKIPPFAFISLILYYFCAETWFAILFTVIIEVCPTEVKSAMIGVFLFIMNNIGGNLPVIVDPLAKSMGYREAIYFVWPGCVGISSVMFFVASIPLWRQARLSQL
eukprot:TCALIF_11302-PA protein Name:"Similar to spns2 Protein spinster homolog 2 (Danio rerio)" AED:0.05 eAED:0.05 QI:1/0/0/1/0.5/0.33/3/0/447